MAPGVAPADVSGQPADARKAALVQAGVLTIAGQLLKLVVSMGSTIVLARLLQPGDFGLLAMVYSLISFVGSFRDFGLPMAALQSRGVDHARASALFWMNLRITLCVTLFTFAMGPVLAWFYGDARLTLLTAALSIGVFAAALANQHEALLTRQMRFGTLVACDLITLSAGSLIAIALATNGAAYWALAALFVIWQTGRSGAMWAASGWRPAGFRAAAEARDQIQSMVCFGAYLTGYRMLAHLGRDLDRIVVGYVGGAYTLGLYDSAYRWARMPIQQLYTPLLAVIVTGLSQARGDAAAYRRTASAALVPILGVSLPALIYLALESELIILVLLGPTWLPSSPLLRWICIGTVAVAVLKTTKWLYVSMGDTKRQFRWGVVSSPVMVAAIGLGASFEATGVAIGFAAANWLLVLPGLVYCLKGSSLRVRDYAQILARPAFATSVAGSALLAIAPSFRAGPNLLELLVSASVFVLAYAAAWLVLPGGRGAAMDIATLIHRGTTRTRARASLRSSVVA